MRILIFIVGIVLMATGCGALGIVKNIFGFGVNDLPPEVTNTIFAWLASFAGAINPLAGVVVTALGAGLVAVRKSNGQKKIVAAIGGALDSMSDQDVRMVKASLVKAMDDKTRKMISKIKKKL